MSAYKEDEDTEESGGRNIKIPSGGKIMKQSYKIYENLLSAVAVYRTGATKNSSFYKVGKLPGLRCPKNYQYYLILFDVVNLIEFLRELCSHS